MPEKRGLSDWKGFGTPEEFRKWGLRQGMVLLVGFVVLFIVAVGATIWAAFG